jgi:hypothetical protein
MIAVTDMKDLAQRLSAPAMLLEMLRQCHGIGPCLAKVCAQVIDADRLRTQTGQQRIPRRRAHRLVAICLLKQHASRRQPVKMRRFRRASVTAGNRLEIIDTDQQYVWPMLVRVGVLLRGHTTAAPARQVYPRDGK